MLSDDGHLLINIMNPKVKGKMFPSCDEVVDELREHFKGRWEWESCRIIIRIIFKWSDVKGEDDSQVSDKEGIDRTAMQDFMKKLYMENVWWFSKTNKDLFLPNNNNHWRVFV